MTSNAAILRDLQAEGVFAEERHGFIVRTLNANDTDCRRDDVEAFIDGKWQLVVAASLNWETELPGALEAVQRGDHPFPLSAGLVPKAAAPATLPEEAPTAFSDSMTAQVRTNRVIRTSELVVAEHPEL